MTRNDYIKIARVLSESRDTLNTAAQYGITPSQCIASRFADMLEQENPRFNREKFLAAARA